MLPFICCLRRLSILVAVICVPASLMAQTWYDWKDTAPDGNWTRGADGARWWPGDLWDLPDWNNVLKFNNNHYSSSTNNAVNYHVNGLVFGNGATESHTINGNTLYFSKATYNPFIQNEASGTLQTIALDIVGASDASLEIKPGGDMTFSGAINNNGSWIDLFWDSYKMVTFSGVVSGGGGLAINDYVKVKIANAMTYTGGTEVKEGELWIDQGGSLKGNITISFADRPADTAKLFVSDGDGGTTVTNNITVNSGNTDTRYIGALNTSGVNTISGGVTMNSETVYQVVNSGGTLEISGGITGSGGVKKTDSGTLVLSGDNSYSGNTTVSTGVLRASHNNALGATNGNTTVVEGGTLQLSGGMSTAENLVLRGSGVGDEGALVSVSGSNTVTGSISIDGSAPSVTRVGANSGASLTVGGVTAASGKEFWIVGAGNTAVTGQISSDAAFVKFGSGTATLSGNNTTLSANKYLREGTVVLSNNNAFSSSGTTELGWLDGTHNEQVAELRIGDGVNHGGKVVAGYISNGQRVTMGVGDSAAGEMSGTVDLAHDLTLGAGTGGRLTVSGSMTNTGGITKTGAGTLVLSGNNTYSGATTVETGKLVVNGSIAGSAVSVENGATLAGSGTVGTTIVNSGATIAPGNSPGTMTINGDMTWNGGGKYDWEIFNLGGPAGTGWDFISVGDELLFSNLSPENKFNINLFSLSATNSAGPLAGWSSTGDYAWKILGTGATVSGFSADYFSINATGFSSYNAVSGLFALEMRDNDKGLYLTYKGGSEPVPEPGTWGAAALLAGCAGFLRWRKRRRS